MCSFASWQVRRMVPSCRIHVTRASSDAMRASSYFITHKGAHAKLPVELHVGEGRGKERGGPARKRAVFIVMRRNLGKKAGSAYQPQVDDLALCSHADCGCSPQRAGIALERPSLDENHPISGRLPRFPGQNAAPRRPMSFPTSKNENDAKRIETCAMGSRLG